MKGLGLWTFHGVGRSTAEVDQGSDRASRGSSGFKLVLISESEGELKDYVRGLKGVITVLMLYCQIVCSV